MKSVAPAIPAALSERTVTPSFDILEAEIRTCHGRPHLAQWKKVSEGEQIKHVLSFIAAFSVRDLGEMPLPAAQSSNHMGRTAVMDENETPNMILGWFKERLLQ